MAATYSLTTHTASGTYLRLVQTINGLYYDGGGNLLNIGGGSTFSGSQNFEEVLSQGNTSSQGYILVNGASTQIIDTTVSGSLQPYNNSDAYGVYIGGQSTHADLQLGVFNGKQTILFYNEDTFTTLNLIPASQSSGQNNTLQFPDKSGVLATLGDIIGLSASLNAGLILFTNDQNEIITDASLQYSLSTNYFQIDTNRSGLFSNNSIMSMGDFNGNGNGTRITIDDSTETILLQGDVIMNNIANSILYTDISGDVHGVNVGSGLTFDTITGILAATGSGSGSQGPQGSTGPQGLQGTSGLKGSTGSQGPVGAQGNQGSNGSNGQQGATGPQGLQGNNGLQGAQGNNGINGATGPQGFQGNSGTNGTNGTNGSTGSQGPIGSQGFQGNSGTNGTNGTNGSTGSQGPIGPQGFQGSNGLNGATGSQGSQGTQGNQGSNGATGPQGLQGPSGGGTASVGPQGFQGVTGPQGFQGPQGTAGSNGLNGATGSQGFQGTQGNQGAIGVGSTGPQGFQGNQGSTGTNGINGATGPQGFQGNQGSFGVNGVTGSQGPIGPQGFQGAQGFQGTFGINGTTGSTGPQGFQGNQGSTGTNGATGATGFQGPQGTQGFQGVQGRTGSNGATGSQGPQGTQGNTGIQGATGPQGFQGTQGNTGTGIQGATGPQGPAGGGSGGSFTFSTGLTNSAGIITNNLSTGVKGGQKVIGDTLAGGSLTLQSTANASRGNIYFGTGGADLYAEPAGMLYLNQATITQQLFTGPIFPFYDSTSGATWFQYNGGGSGAFNVEMGDISSLGNSIRFMVDDSGVGMHFYSSSSDIYLNMNPVYGSINLNWPSISGTLMVISQKDQTLVTANPPLYVVPGTYYTVKLPTIASGATVRLPTPAASNVGQIIKIWNQNTSGTSAWVVTPIIRDASNNPVSTLVNNKWYNLESDGVNWNIYA